MMSPSLTFFQSSFVCRRLEDCFRTQRRPKGTARVNRVPTSHLPVSCCATRLVRYGSRKSYQRGQGLLVLRKIDRLARSFLQEDNNCKQSSSIRRIVCDPPETRTGLTGTLSLVSLFVRLVHIERPYRCHTTLGGPVSHQKWNCRNSLEQSSELHLRTSGVPSAEVVCLSPTNK